MAGFTTPEQDRRFHEVADRFDPTTRRKVRRSVARGAPRVDDEVRPLALLYLERMERNASTSTRRLFPVWIGLGIAEVMAAIFAWTTESTFQATVLTICGTVFVVNGRLMSKSKAKLPSRLQRSRVLMTR